MASTTQLSTLLTDLEARLDDDGIFWPTTQLTSWLNEGAREVAMRGECLLQEQAENVIAASASYAAPADMVRIHRIEYFYSANDVWPLQYRTPHSMDQVWSGVRSQPSTRPRYFTMWGVTPGANIQLFPVPAASTASGFPYFNIWYYRLPVPMVNPTDFLDLPQGWDALPTLYAEFTALRKDKDPSWKDAKGIYDERLSELIRLTRWQVDQSGQYAGEDIPLGYPSWLVSGDDW